MKFSIRTYARTCAAFFLLLHAEPGEARQEPCCAYQRNEVRIGIGDMLFETMVWHNQVHRDYKHYPDGVTATENNHFGYTPHFCVEYSRYFLPWLNVGITADIQNTSWTKETYDNRNALKGSSKENFYNFCIMPTINFTYFRRPHVGLYSALGAGIDINGGTEVDYAGRKTEVGAAIDLRLVGVTAGAGHWWGFFDIGGTFAMQNKDAIFLMGSQLMRIGACYRF